MKIPSYVSLWICIIFAFPGLLVPGVSLGQTAPVIGLHENTPNVVALANARIVTEPGHVLDNATLLIRDEHIEAIGSTITVPPDAVVRDMKGLTIYPGFIDLYTHYGIHENSKNPEESGSVHWNTAVRPDL